MTYHFIRHKPSGGLLTMVDPTSKPMYMCFKNKICAERCKKHLAHFKSNHGVWPVINLSNETTQVIAPLKTESLTMSHMYSQLIIDTIGEDKLITMGTVTGSSVMYCHEFGVLRDGSDMLNVSFSGQELEIEPDYDEYIRSLENGIYG